MTDIENTNAISKQVKIVHSEAVSPSDSVDLPSGATTGLLVDVTGAVKVTYISGATDTLTLAAGVWHPMGVIRVWAASLTASGVHAGY